MSFRYHLHYGSGLGITELGRAGRGLPGAYQWNNAASSSMVFNSVSERKQVFVGSTVLQHTKQDIFIDTLSVFSSEKQSSRGKCYWPWGKKKSRKIQFCAFLSAGSVSGCFAGSISFYLSACSPTAPKHWEWLLGSRESPLTLSSSTKQQRK